MKFRILALWNQYRTQVLPPDASSVQVQETRRAFYAGVECTLNRLGSEISQGDTLDDQNDEKMIKEVHLELQEFAADIQSGKA